MQKYYIIHKNLGETPLQALERLRESCDISQQTPMTYAGRLDPLAEGELLILVGEECKQKERYIGLDKEYEVEILLGAQTDTGDVMGKVVDNLEVLTEDKTVKKDFGIEEIRKVLEKFTGKVNWTYPAFSSKTVQGKPLFLWSLEGKIDEVEAPLRESEIYELELLGGSTSKLGASELREQVHSKINSITPVPKDVASKRLGADFRRAEVLASWAAFFAKCPKTPFGHKRELEVIKVRCKCSSGTYMRTLAQKIGEELGVPALALSIVRTEIVVE